jgi:hypothetical protein
MNFKEELINNKSKLINQGYYKFSYNLKEQIDLNFYYNKIKEEINEKSYATKIISTSDLLSQINIDSAFNDF